MDIYLDYLKRVFQDKCVNTWAHHGPFLARRNMEIDPDVLKDMLKQMEHNNILLKVNRKYNLPGKEWIEEAERIGLIIVRESDVHSIEELEWSDNIFEALRDK